MSKQEERGDYYLKQKSALQNLLQISPSPIVDRKWVVQGGDPTSSAK